MKHFNTSNSSYLTRDDKDTPLALLLDYDGTLAPITEHPSQTYMLPRTAAVLHRLTAHRRVHMAVISGRARADVQRRVGLADCTYSGNHGLEIRTPDGNDWTFAVPEQMRRNFERLLVTMDERVAHSGAWVENKVASLTFHYREAPLELHAALRSEACAIVEALGFVACGAHYAIEAKPPVQWNKGDAALRILAERFGDNWSDDGGRRVKVIFAGDDRSDEDAMRALRGRGARTFRISDRSDVETCADFRLDSQEMVTVLLEWIEGAL